MKPLIGLSFILNSIIAVGVAYVMVKAPLTLGQSGFDIGVNLLMLVAVLSMLWGARYGMSRPTWTVAFTTNSLLLLAFCLTLVFVGRVVEAVGLPLIAIAVCWVSVNLSLLFWIAGQSPRSEAKNGDD
jgi:hypothetical protein